MENLILCSKTLYDVDVSNKMKEIADLKKKITALERELGVNVAPKVFCKNHKEWHAKVGYVLEYIYDNISNIQLIGAAGGWGGQVAGDGLWLSSDRVLKTELLEQVFIWLTGAEKWSHKVARELMSDITTVMDLLKLPFRYTEEERRGFINIFMYEKLCGKHSRETSLLADIPQYKCDVCGSIYNDPYDSEDGGDTFDINESCGDCDAHSVLD